jgi:hypothetical protein
MGNNYNLGMNRSLRHWVQVPNCFIAPLSTAVLYVVKKDRRQNCVRHWELVSYLPTSVRGGAESFKSSHMMGDQPIFLKTSAPYSLMTTLSNEPTFSQIHLAGHYL